MQIFGIVLAAGQGKRMKSKLYKVLHPVCGKPMIDYVVTALKQSGVDRLVTIVGHGAEAVREYLGDRTEYALQEQQLGTGHAVLQAEPLLGNQDGITLVVNGDAPLVNAESLKAMVELHRTRNAAATIMTADVNDPGAYGRIIRREDGSIDRIVEFKDCTPEQARIREVNTGLYCFDNRFLFEALKQVTNENAQQEYYLTDVAAIARKAGRRVEAYLLADPDEGIGVNDRLELAEAEKRMRRKLIEKHMKNGVTVIDPDQTYVEADVSIGPDTILYPGTILKGNTVIGEGCRIGPYTEISNCTIGNHVQIRQSVLDQSSVQDGATIGPFAYIRPGSDIGPNVKIGDFVEIKNSTIGANSKVPHLSYVGDADVGERVNIGCGVITANYDGFRKHRTVIDDEAFIGSNVNLIAPVSVGKGAFIVAGSTITENVGDDGVAIARSRQTTKPGYASKLKNRIKTKGNSTSGG